MTKQQIIPGKMGQFVRQMGALIERAQGDEEMILSQGASLLQALVCEDDWLPESCAIPDTRFYQQYLLYCDPRERFSVVSFVWGPGQSTPIHDHTVWGLVGMLRGAEKEERFALEGDSLVQLGTARLSPGDIGMVSPSIGDIHRVSNALDDQVSISIHVYGGDIGRISRHVLTPEGVTKSFVSGYANKELPDFSALHATQAEHPTHLNAS